MCRDPLLQIDIAEEQTARLVCARIVTPIIDRQKVNYVPQPASRRD